MTGVDFYAVILKFYMFKNKFRVISYLMRFQVTRVVKEIIFLSQGEKLDYIFLGQISDAVVISDPLSCLQNNVCECHSLIRTFTIAVNSYVLLSTV